MKGCKFEVENFENRQCKCAHNYFRLTQHEEAYVLKTQGEVDFSIGETLSLQIENESICIEQRDHTTSTQIIIANGAASPNITSGIVVLENLKQ